MMDYEHESASADQLFGQLNEKANAVYKFVMRYNSHMAQKHDYGVNMAEVHVLTAIEENPGITISQLANMWGRTSSALSQTATKLERKGCITRCKDSANARMVKLYATETGKKLSLAHKAYDVLDMTQTLHELMRHCSLQEAEIFLRVLNYYVQILEEST